MRNTIAFTRIPFPIGPRRYRNLMHRPHCVNMEYAPWLSARGLKHPLRLYHKNISAQVILYSECLFVCHALVLYIFLFPWPKNNTFLIRFYGLVYMILWMEKKYLPFHTIHYVPVSTCFLHLQ